MHSSSQDYEISFIGFYKAAERLLGTRGLDSIVILGRGGNTVRLRNTKMRQRRKDLERAVGNDARYKWPNRRWVCNSV